MTDQEIKDKLLEIANRYDDGWSLDDLANKLEELFTEVQRQHGKTLMMGGLT